MRSMLASGRMAKAVTAQSIAENISTNPLKSRGHYEGDRGEIAFPGGASARCGGRAAGATGLRGTIERGHRHCTQDQRGPPARGSCGGQRSSSGEDIARSGLKGPTDLQWQLPAVEFQTAQSVPDVFIRGVGTYNLQAGVDSAVAFSIDGIYLAHPSAYPPVLVDIAQVEEVRGPQGTLYGRNSNGGAISFVSNKPMLGQWDAEAGISTGNYAAFSSNFMVNVPITDTLATRFAIGTDRQDAIWANGYGVHNNFTARWRTLFQPIENLELIATLDRSRVSDNGFTGDACAPGGNDCPPHSFHPWTGVGPRNPGDFDHIDTWGAYLEANLKLSWATITSLTSYRNSDWQSQITSTVGDALPAYSPAGVLNPADMNIGIHTGSELPG